jgi:hypothetical protein
MSTLITNKKDGGQIGTRLHSEKLETFYYDNAIVRMFAIATAI